MQTHQATPAPRRSGAKYQAKRRTHSVLLYFRSIDELVGYRAAAEAGGYGHNFNRWLLQMLANATSGAVYPEARQVQPTSHTAAASWGGMASST